MQSWMTRDSAQDLWNDRHKCRSPWKLSSEEGYNRQVKLLLGTQNRGKIIEMSEALARLPVELWTPRDAEVADVPEESGATFEENALAKARFFHERTRLPTLADDSGIIVEALSNELGFHTRRWGAGPQASDEEWIAHFLERMRDEKNKRAHFVCTLAFIDASGEPHVFEGRCSGAITNALEADYLPGLPISACFKPEGYGKVFSALSLNEKNAVSHRGRALQSFVRFLEQELSK